jgi:hypothetical protein
MRTSAAHIAVARDLSRPGLLRARSREPADDRVHGPVDALVDDADDDVLPPVAVVPQSGDPEQCPNRVDVDRRLERAAVDPAQRARRVENRDCVRRLTLHVPERGIPVREEGYLGVRPDLHTRSCA